MPVYVKMVRNMTASWGNDTACVAEQPKQWVFDGDGLASDGATDLIKFVVNRTDCESGSDATLSEADRDGTAMYLSAGKNATFTIDPGAAGNSVFLCYKFGNEIFQWYDKRAYVHMLQLVGSRTGGTDIAVVDVQEVLVIHANGTSLQDNIRWVVSDQGISSDAICNNAVVDIWDDFDEETDPTTEAPVYARGGVFLANFTFDTSSAGLSPNLCYKFSGRALPHACPSVHRRQLCVQLRASLQVELYSRMCRLYSSSMDLLTTS